MYSGTFFNRRLGVARPPVCKHSRSRWGWRSFFFGIPNTARIRPSAPVDYWTRRHHVRRPVLPTGSAASPFASPPLVTSPSVTPTGPAGRRAGRLDQSIQHNYLGTATLRHHSLLRVPWNVYPSPYPLFTMSTLQQVLWRQSAGGELYRGNSTEKPLEGNSIEELFQRAGQLEGLQFYSLRMLRSHKLIREPVLEPVLEPVREPCQERLMSGNVL